MPSIPELLASRATIAFAVECLARGMPLPGQQCQTPEQHQNTIANYDGVQAQLAPLMEAYAVAWHPPRWSAVLPWCSICGSAERELLPEQMLCTVCARLTLTDAPP